MGAIKDTELGVGRHKAPAVLKVLHVSAVAERGGLEVVLLNILRCLDRSLFVPEVALLEHGPFVHEVQETGTKTHVIEAGRVRAIIKGSKAIASLVRLIRAQGIDLVHSHNAKAHIYGGMAARIARVPCLYHLHGVPRPSISRDGFVSVVSMVVPARQTIACSSYVAQAFKAVWRTRRDVKVIHNGIIAGGTGTDGAVAVRREFGIPDSAPLVLLATRLQRSKGVHVFLDSVVDIVRDYSESRFIVVGGTMFGLERAYAEQLHRQVVRLGLEGFVFFPGYRPDVAGFFEAADVVVHSSIEPDSFPTVLLEAMSWAKPVVASDIGGAREIVEDGVTGLLVLPNRSDTLAQAVLTLLRDRDRSHEMGQAGALRVRDLFSASRMLRVLEATYQQLIRGPHSAEL